MYKPLLLGVALLSSSALAQSARVGERVEASPLMMDSRWENCTVMGLLPGGDVAVACGARDTEYVVHAKWVRGFDESTAPGPAIPARVAAASDAPSGAYQCQGGAAGNVRITINGGRWQGYYAETLPDGRVGLASRPNARPYQMVCEPR